MEDQINHPVDTTDLRQQVSDLRRQTTVLYMALAVLSLTLAGFVGLQSRRASKDLQGIKPGATAVVDQYRKSEANIKTFVGQLQAYGRANPDYAQRILARYPVGAPVAAQAPAATAPPR